MKTLANILTTAAVILTVVFSSQAQNRFSKTQDQGYKEPIQSIKKQNRYKIKDSQKAVKPKTFYKGKPNDISFSKIIDGTSKTGSIIYSKRKRPNRNPPAGQVIQIASKNIIKKKPGKELTQSK